MNEQEAKNAVAQLLRSVEQRDALAELIIEYVQPNHLTTDYVSRLLSTRRLNPGDALVKKVRKGIEVRTLVPGSVHLASEITVKERINYVLDGADVKVTFNEWDLRNGDIGTLDEIRNEMAAKLSDHFLNKVFTALSTVWSAVNTPDNFTSVGGPITATALENAIDRINQTTPGVKVVIGTRAAVTPITKFGAFWSDGTNVEASQTALDEIRNTGLLGKYYGATIVALDQVFDNPEDYNPLLPDDKILVIGENVGEFITFGDVLRKQWIDMAPTPPNWFLEIYQQFGMIIDNAQGIYVLGDLS